MSNHGKIFIPDHEYKERVTRAAKILQREKLDAMIVIFQDFGHCLKDQGLLFQLLEMQL